MSPPATQCYPRTRRLRPRCRSTEAPPQFPSTRSLNRFLFCAGTGSCSMRISPLSTETRVLVQAVKRNIDRFPDDFMLQLTTQEWAALRSQSVILKPGRGQHLDTSSKGAFAFFSQGKTDAVMERLKGEAAKLGANGILLEGVGDQAGGSVGTGFANATASVDALGVLYFKSD